MNKGTFFNITLSSYTYTDKYHIDDADKHHVDDKSHTDTAKTSNDNNSGSVTCSFIFLIIYLQTAYLFYC